MTWREQLVDHCIGKPWVADHCVRNSQTRSRLVQALNRLGFVVLPARVVHEHADIRDYLDRDDQGYRP